MSWIQYVLLQASHMLCHRKTQAMRRGWAKKSGYWQLWHLGDGCSSHRSRKDHFCYFSSLYFTTYFYPLGPIIYPRGYREDRASPSATYSSGIPWNQARHSHCMTYHSEQQQTPLLGVSCLCGKLSTQNMWTMCTTYTDCTPAIPAVPWKSLAKLKPWMGFLQVKYSKVFLCILLL